MPIYEYECPLCGKFEVIQGFSDKPLKADPECSQKKCPRSAIRVISAPAFHLKGTGWYKTDYPSSSSTSSSATTKEATETKPAPAAKPEKKGS